MRIAAPMKGTLTALIVFGSLAGCAGLPLPAPGTGEKPPAAEAVDPFAALAEEYESRARAAEAAGERRQALEAWRIAAALRPGNTAADGEVSRLSSSLTASADEHYHRGLALLENEFFPAARKEFLLALADDPGHAGALDTLKNRMERDTFTYRVEEGDTFESIAVKAYRDPDLAFLVARSNDLDPDSGPLPGKDLTLPLLDEETWEGAPPAAPAMPSVPAAPKGPAKTPEKSQAGLRLAKAEGYLEAGSYQDALAAAAGIPAGAPEAEAASKIINAAHYGTGMSEEKKGDYLAALTAYEKVNPGYRDVKKKISITRKMVVGLAEEHYKAGVQYFVNQKLEQAVTEWEETLRLNPDHPNARKDLVKARKLIEELQKIQ
jgi:tetratricopeptide (TPR) repeat protein